MKGSLKDFWRDWIISGRIVPLTTVVAAVIVGLLGLLGLIQMSSFEAITLTLLGLLAFDALVERLGILEKIRSSLEAISKSGVSRPYLVWERDLLEKEPFERFLLGANELFISGGSLAGLFRYQSEIISQWLDRAPKARIRLVVLDPSIVRADKVSVASLYRDSELDKESKGQEAYAREIDYTIGKVRLLHKKYASRVEIHVTDKTPSVTVMIVDCARARISVNLNSIYSPQRPVFEVSRTMHPDWFKEFEERYYNELWTGSSPYMFPGEEQKPA